MPNCSVVECALFVIVSFVSCRYPWLYVHRLGERGQEIMFCIWCWKDRRKNSFATGCTSIRKALIQGHPNTESHRAAAAGRLNKEVFTVVEVRCTQHEFSVNHWTPNCRISLFIIWCRVTMLRSRKQEKIGESRLQVLTCLQNVTSLSLPTDQSSNCSK